MNELIRTNGWRIALVVGGGLALVGGPQHPSSDAKDPLRQELAVMTADPAWVPSHTILLGSVVFITLGLLVARNASGWPAGAAWALRLAGVAMALYSVEAAFHLAAVVDSDRLAAGDFAPVAFAHLGLAIVLYPVSGVAIMYLAWKLLPSWSLPQRPFAVAGILGGALHATALPATLVFADVELSPMFAFAGILTAVFAISVGVVGLRSWRSEVAPPLVTASA